MEEMSISEEMNSVNVTTALNQLAKRPDGPHELLDAKIQWVWRMLRMLYTTDVNFLEILRYSKHFGFGEK